VTEEANRMGLRLEGAALAVRSGGHMITEGVALGAIQAPPGGQPIILFVEQQTTGGYPKIANVIAADLASVGQLRPRDEVRFELVDLATARALLREQEEVIRALD
jgi:antagonist of KipI